MVRRRQRERGPFEVLLPDADKLWPAWLKRIDTLLEDETVIDTVATALAPKVITDLHQRVVDVAQRAGVTHGHNVVESFLVIVRPVRSGPAWPSNSPRLPSPVIRRRRATLRASAFL